MGRRAWAMAARSMVWCHATALVHQQQRLGCATMRAIVLRAPAVQAAVGGDERLEAGRRRRGAAAGEGGGQGDAVESEACHRAMTSEQRERATIRSHACLSILARGAASARGGEVLGEGEQQRRLHRQRGQHRGEHLRQGAARCVYPWGVPPLSPLGSWRTLISAVIANPPVRAPRRRSRRPQTTAWSTG